MANSSGEGSLKPLLNICSKMEKNQGSKSRTPTKIGEVDQNQPMNVIHWDDFVENWNGTTPTMACLECLLSISPAP